MPSPQNARRRCALSISSSVDVVAFISPGQPGRTATNTYDFASGRAVAGDDPVNQSDPSGLCNSQGNGNLWDVGNPWSQNNPIYCWSQKNPGAGSVVSTA